VARPVASRGVARAARAAPVRPCDAPDGPATRARGLRPGPLFAVRRDNPLDRS